MTEILLETEAKERLQHPEDNSLFLEQMSVNEKLKTKPLDFLEGTHEPGRSVKQQLLNVMSKVEKKYPQIIQLKEQAEIASSGDSKIETASGLSTLSQRYPSTPTFEGSSSSSGKQRQPENRHPGWWIFSWWGQPAQKNIPPEKQSVKYR